MKDLRCQFKAHWFLGQLQMNLICWGTICFFTTTPLVLSSHSGSFFLTLLQEGNYDHHADHISPSFRRSDLWGLKHILLWRIYHPCGCRMVVAFPLYFAGVPSAFAWDPSPHPFASGAGRVATCRHQHGPRQQDSGRVCGLFPMEGVEFKFSFVILNHCPNKKYWFSIWPCFFETITL